MDATFTIYEMKLRGVKPTPDFLRQRRDLDAFRKKYREFLSDFTAQHPLAKELHVFLAVPAPVAVVLGHDLLPKVHPTLLVYDAEMRSGVFILPMKVNDYEC
jgi:hypothetical protein